uniref:Conserved oligomeric Golgi complex subunit 6 n=1 Tax=Parascaris equorum TaxID=6256 RepID=A0A914S688_PAREQ
MLGLCSILTVVDWRWISIGTGSMMDMTFADAFLFAHAGCFSMPVGVLVQSIAAMQDREVLFKYAIEEYTTARRNYIVRAYIDALTRGGYVLWDLSSKCALKVGMEKESGGCGLLRMNV